MVKGHLNQTRKNQRSTKPVEPHPRQVPLLEHVRTLLAAILHTQITADRFFTDQTGRFIVSSSDGNNQLFVLLDYDVNFIAAEPMKNKSSPDIISAYKRAYKKPWQAGLSPKLQRLDNECSEALKE
jgi:hypothetical protein